MSFETLQTAILEEARGRAASVMENWRDRTRTEEKRIRQSARELEEEIIRAAEARGSQEAKRLRQERVLEAKAFILRAKQEELEATQQAVTENILSWDEAKTRNLLEGLLMLLTDRTDGTLIPGSYHAELLKKLTDEQGIDCSEDVVNDDGGFIYRTPTSEFNVTIRNLVAQIFARHRAELAGRLFG